MGYKIYRDYSDDDDMSWKVRRSSSKVLAAIVGTRHELLSQLYQSVAPALVNRFKEREESVRVDVLQTFIVLLRQTLVYGGEVYMTRENDHEPKRRRAIGPSESQERYNLFKIYNSTFISIFKISFISIIFI